MSIHLPKSVCRAFPDWIPAAQTVGAQDPPQPGLFPAFQFKSCVTVVKPLFIKPFSLYLKSVSPQTLRNSIGNGLDWDLGSLSTFTIRSLFDDLEERALMKTAPRGPSKRPLGFNRCLSHEVISGDKQFLSQSESFATLIHGDLCY